MNNRSVVARLLSLPLCVAAFLCLGCVHYIHVSPSPSVQAVRTIPSSVRIQIPFLAIEGADHMPGIPAFEWPKKDLQAAIIDYVEKRRTFASVGNDGALTLSIKSWLMMRSRSEYRYTVRLESDLGPTGKPPIKSYVAEAEEKGSTVRWVTASDRNPIERAVQATLDDLLTQIEADVELFR